MGDDKMKLITLNEAERQLKRIHDIYQFIKDENDQSTDSILTIIGRKFHDENAISDYLAYVLDPQFNGVGHQPLNNFLKLLNSPIELSDADHIHIEREYRLPNNRRIDFLITINEESIIAMEHKVFSEEHGDQTWDYEKELEKSLHGKVDHITYVFLTPNGKKALNSTFVPVSYHQLVTALKDVNVNFIADIRKAVLFNEMIFHLEGYFLDDKKIALSDKTTLYLEHQEMIQDLKKQFEQDYYKIFKYIESVIENYFTDNVEGEWDFDFKKNRSYHQIYKPHWKTKDLDIHFELKLSRDSLVNHKMSFLLDIEGRKRSDFKVAHEQNLKEQLTNIMNKHDILYRQGKRADTFAIKSYHFLTPDNLKDEATLKSNLVGMMRDFTKFIGIVDQEINYFHNN